MATAAILNTTWNRFDTDPQGDGYYFLAFGVGLHLALLPSILRFALKVADDVSMPTDFKVAIQKGSDWGVFGIFLALARFFSAAFFYTYWHVGFYHWDVNGVTMESSGEMRDIKNLDYRIFYNWVIGAYYIHIFLLVASILFEKGGVMHDFVSLPMSYVCRTLATLVFGLALAFAFHIINYPVYVFGIIFTGVIVIDWFMDTRYMWKHWNEWKWFSVLGTKMKRGKKSKATTEG